MRRVCIVCKRKEWIYRRRRRFFVNYCCSQRCNMSTAVDSACTIWLAMTRPMLCIIANPGRKDDANPIYYMQLHTEETPTVWPHMQDGGQQEVKDTDVRNCRRNE